MALFVPIIIGVPVGYFTWAKVFNSVDESVYKLTQNNNEQLLQKPPTSSLGATVGSVVSMGILSKFMFTPATRHRLFFATLPPNSNMRIETIKMGIELLVRSGVVFYGGAIVGASSGRISAKQ